MDEPGSAGQTGRIRQRAQVGAWLVGRVRRVDAHGVDRRRRTYMNGFQVHAGQRVACGVAACGERLGVIVSEIFGEFWARLPGVADQFFRRLRLRRPDAEQQGEGERYGREDARHGCTSRRGSPARHVCQALSTTAACGLRCSGIHTVSLLTFFIYCLCVLFREIAYHTRFAYNLFPPNLGGLTKK